MTDDAAEWFRWDGKKWVPNPSAVRQDGDPVAEQAADDRFFVGLLLHLPAALLLWGLVAGLLCLALGPAS